MAMTKDDIIRMAQEAGFQESFIGGLSGRSETDTLFYIGEYPCGEEVFMLVNLAFAAGARAEREACANVCDSYDVADDVCSSDTAEGIAIAIRSRDNNGL